MKFAPFAMAFAAGSVAVMSAAYAETRDYDLPNFDKIDVSAGIMLVATVGEDQAVSVETKHGDFSDFEIKVRNGRLYATRENTRLRWHKNKSDYKVTISVSDLNEISASSGSHADVTNIDANEFDIDASSGAHIKLAGNCNKCNIDLSSGANIKAKELKCESAVIDVSSGGNGAVSVRESVVADASSGGHVRVYGAPQYVNVDKSSGGSIRIASQD